jgi:IS30 family transposase
MPKIYTDLTTQERAVVMTMRDDQCSIRAIAKPLGRAPVRSAANFAVAQYRRLRRQPCAIAECARRIAPRRLPKRHADGALFQLLRQ